MFGSANGLKVTVEVAKSIQANAFIQHDIFHVSFRKLKGTFSVCVHSRKNIKEILAILVPISYLPCSCHRKELMIQ